MRGLLSLQFTTSIAAAALTSFAVSSPAGAAMPSLDEYIVNTTDDTVDVSPGDGVCSDQNGNCSLRAAVMEANALGRDAFIVLQPLATYTLTLAGAGEDGAATGDIDVATRVLLQGRNSIVDAAGLDRAFDVAHGARLDVRRLYVINGSVTAESGGAYRSAGQLLLQNCGVQSCSATGAGASGGAIFNSGGFLSLSRTQLASNEAERAGGAIEASAGVTRVLGGLMRDNMAGPGPGNGGGLHLSGGGVVELDGVRFASNRASREGGGVWNSSTGSMTVHSCCFDNNRAMGPESHDGGGGLFNDGGILEVTNSEVLGNRADMGSGSGGGLFNNGGQMNVVDTDVIGNASMRAGGGIECLAGTTTVEGGSMTSNDTGPVPGNGGGLHLSGAGNVEVRGVQFWGNTATAEGGAIWNSADGTMTIAGCTMMNNRASGNDSDQGGGGAFNDGGQMTISESQISGNFADGASGSGGGILNNQGVLRVSGTSIRDNDSQRAGGGIESNIGTTHLSMIRLSGNRSGASPGNGGGLHLTGAGLVSISGGSITGNDSDNEGGGLWNSSTGVMIVTGVDIRGNTSPDGPNVFNDGGTFLVDGESVDP